VSSSPPVGEGADADGPFRRQVLTELRAIGGDALVRELMTIFAESTPDRLHSAEASIAAGDLEAAAAALHSLCSASGTVGAGRLGELARRLERAARGEAAEELVAGFSQLRLEAEEVLRAARRLSSS
jgi:HPt (histidine-containing phosphotransfer) domain-containing protein